MFKPKESWKAREEMNSIIESIINNIKTCDIKKLFSSLPPNGILLKDLCN